MTQEFSEIHIYAHYLNVVENYKYQTHSVTYTYAENSIFVLYRPLQQVPAWRQVFYDPIP